MRALFRLVLLGSLLVSGLRAFDLRTDDSGVYVVKWYEPTVSVQIKLATTANLSDGSSQASAVEQAAELWNDYMGTLRLVSTRAGPNSLIARNDINEIVMADDVDGDEFPVGALAVTRSRGTMGNAVAEADIVFNGSVTWDSYEGAPKATADIRRVAVHELGHLLGLLHPDDAGQNVNAIMNSSVGGIRSPTTDDRNGIQALYGAPGQAPPNNDFVDAIDLSFTGTRDWWGGGFNVGGDREPNEPAHAGVASGHSVWWKWTAPGSAQLSIDTFGSNFDTVLAVYTGTALNTLTKVAENDDAETPEQNPTPQRRRTSIVNFEAVAGTTYFIAVDGWGDPERFPPGSTGTVQLAMNFDPENSSPAIHTQPSEGGKPAGWRVLFTVGVVPSENLAYRWQRLPAGGGADDWKDVVDGGDYAGAQTYQLGVDTRYTMNGDQFRCVITNAFGAATTRIVPLAVTRGPLPTIPVQPRDITAEVGDRLTLTVEGAMSVHPNNVVPLTYQWYHDSIPIPGATSATLTVASARLGDAGNYRAEVTNASGAVSSRSATVQVANVPLVTLVGARHRVLTAGEPLTLAADASGTGPLSFQWYHDGQPVDGATQATLDVPTTTDATAGAYWVRVTDAAGTRSGDPIFVTVAAPKTRLAAWGWTSFNHHVIPAGLDRTVGVAVDHFSAVAIQADGSFVEWAGPDRYTLPRDLNSVVAMAKYAGFNAALLADGTVVDSKWPDRVPVNLSRVVAIARGVDFLLALRTDGKVFAWGEANSGVVNTLPANLTDVVAIAAGQYHAIAVKRDGSVVAWGQLQSGHPPTPPAGLSGVVAAAAGANYTLVLKADGTLTYWGAYPQNPDMTALTDVVAIAGGTEHSLALHRDGTVSGWGTFKATVPEGLTRVRAIAAGEDVSLVVMEADPDPVGPASRLLNLSVRSNAGFDDQTLVMGFVIDGGGAQNVLTRGIGPGLAPFGVTGVLQDPQLTLYQSNATAVGLNNDWEDSADLRSVFSGLGAFALSGGSKDAVLFLPLSSGSYSAHVTSTDSSTGVALVEVYDATQTGVTRFTNVSARTTVGTGDGVLVAGFVLEGDAPKTLLIRAVGPSLATFGLDPGSLLADPQLELQRGNETVATNDNWMGGAELKSAFNAVGAFALGSDTSRDAAALVTLAPGVYTVKVSGVNETTGVALVEIYEVP